MCVYVCVCVCVRMRGTSRRCIDVHATRGRMSSEAAAGVGVARSSSGASASHARAPIRPDVWTCAYGYKFRQRGNRVDARAHQHAARHAVPRARTRQTSLFRRSARVARTPALDRPSVVIAAAVLVRPSPDSRHLAVRRRAAALHDTVLAAPAHTHVRTHIYTYKTIPLLVCRLRRRRVSALRHSSLWLLPAPLDLPLRTDAPSQEPLTAG